MNIHDATEAAYKNGYAQGTADAVKVFLAAIEKVEEAQQLRQAALDILRGDDENAKEMAQT